MLPATECLTGSDDLISVMLSKAGLRFIRAARGCVFSQRQGKNLTFLAKSLIGTDREQAAGAQSCPFGYMLAA